MVDGAGISRTLVLLLYLLNESLFKSTLPILLELLLQTLGLG